MLDVKPDNELLVAFEAAVKADSPRQETDAANWPKQRNQTWLRVSAMDRGIPEVDVALHLRVGTTPGMRGEWFTLCLQAATRNLLEHAGAPEILLVHGGYRNYDPSKDAARDARDLQDEDMPMATPPHVWVEIPGGGVFDGVTQRFYDKDTYYQTFRTVDAVRYLPEESWTKVIELRRFGDWERISAGSAMPKEAS